MITIGFSTRKIDNSFVELLKLKCSSGTPPPVLFDKKKTKIFIFFNDAKMSVSKFNIV